MLRVGACLCFVGHGVFGFYRKDAWVAFFGVVGIGRDTAMSMMPWIGALDISVGLAVLVSPRIALLLWMVLWAAWTAALRPLAGQSGWEALERAGNFGVPLVLILLSMPRSWRDLRRSASPIVDSAPWPAARTALAIVTAMLFVGHGALALELKPAIVANVACVFPAASAQAITWWSGVLEMLLAVGLLLRPTARLAFAMAAWKLITEGLFIPAGLPIWEVVERGGSYAAPFAMGLVLLLTNRSIRSVHFSQ